MKIAVTSTGPTLDDQVDSRFGRCSWFLIIDTETMTFEPLENPNTSVGGGAGIQSSQMIAERNVEAVLTGNCGPNAFQTLNAAGVKVIVGVNGPIRRAVKQLKTGKLSPISSPNVSRKSGLGEGT